MLTYYDVYTLVNKMSSVLNLPETMTMEAGGERNFEGQYNDFKRLARNDDAFADSPISSPATITIGFEAVTLTLKF